MKIQNLHGVDKRIDKAIGSQEEKIESLSTYADQLVASENYAKV